MDDRLFYEYCTTKLCVPKTIDEIQRDLQDEDMAKTLEEHLKHAVSQKRLQCKQLQFQGLQIYRLPKPPAVTTALHTPKYNVTRHKSRLSQPFRSPVCLTLDKKLQQEKGKDLSDSHQPTKPQSNTTQKPNILTTPKVQVDSNNVQSTWCRSHVNNDNAVSLTEEIEVLKHKITEKDKEISKLSADYDTEELQHHIKKLHEYNEIKDIGQTLLGKIAEVDGVTTTHLYQRFSLTLDD